MVYYITAWASALLVSMMWAMRRPQAVGRVTCKDSHAFFMLLICLRGNVRPTKLLL